MQVKNVPIGQVKAGPDDGLKDGEFVVYPSTFTREPDAYGDVVANGAFADTIKAWQDSGDTMPGLYGHRMDDPDFFVASATEMSEDEHGWRVKGEFDLESPKGNQVYRLVKGRRLNQLSFAYDVAEDGQIELENGTKANELRKVNVHEFSFVPVGANQDTSVVAVKALTEAITTDIKAGRVLAGKHIQSLRNAHEAIGAVIEAADGDQEDQEGKASESPEANADASAEEPAKANAPVSAEEPPSEPSVDAYLAVISIEEKGVE